MHFFSTVSATLLHWVTRCGWLENEPVVGAQLHNYWLSAIFLITFRLVSDVNVMSNSKLKLSAQRNVLKLFCFSSISSCGQFNRVGTPHYDEMQSQLDSIIWLFLLSVKTEAHDIYDPDIGTNS